MGIRRYYHPILHIFTVWEEVPTDLDRGTRLSRRFGPFSTFEDIFFVGVAANYDARDINDRWAAHRRIFLSLICSLTECYNSNTQKETSKKYTNICKWSVWRAQAILPCPPFFIILSSSFHPFLTKKLFICCWILHEQRRNLWSNCSDRVTIAFFTLSHYRAFILYLITNSLNNLNHPMLNNLSCVFINK